MSSTDSILRSLRREVWIVTAAAGSKRGGLLATWVNAASIDPQRPVMLAGIAPNHFTAELIASSRAFGLHLLRKDQVELAWSFARDSGRDRDKLAGLATSTSVTGSPLLTDVLAWLDCRVMAQHDTGDRIFFWADVVASHQAAHTSPLADCDFIAALAPEQRQQLLSDREKDVQIQRPLHDAWRLKSSGE
jgi:flavin reductase (DIM6/NTAB) family NADH-FMN oxidoreductase RutF